MISGFNSALSALQTYSTKVQSNSNNIANSNTNGYKKTRVTAASVEPEGVKAQVDTVNIAGSAVYEKTDGGMELVESSNVDLATEMTDMNLNSTIYKANLKTVQTMDEMMGTLLDTKS